MIHRSKIEDLRVPWAAIVGAGIVDSLTGAETVVASREENIGISKGISAYFQREVINTILVSKKENHWPCVTCAKR